MSRSRATVIDADEHAATVVLDDPPVRARCTGARLPAGERITARLDVADVASRQVRFERGLIGAAVSGTRARRPGSRRQRTSSANVDRSVAQHARDVGVLLHELRRLAVAAQPGHVLPDQHLRVARRPGTDTDRRDVQRAGDLGGDLGRHDLEHDRERTGVLQRLRVLQEPVRTPRRRDPARGSRRTR